MPDARLLVYDLGLSAASRREMSDPAVWPSVELRRFAFEQWPAWFDINIARGEYAWKTIIATDVLRELGGLVLWQDGGNMFHRRPVEVLRSTATEGAYSTLCVGSLV